LNHIPPTSQCTAFGVCTSCFCPLGVVIVTMLFVVLCLRPRADSNGYALQGLKSTLSLACYSQD
jgi:hypothetical protein